MIDIRVNLCEITTKVLSIGLEGEQNHVRIMFDAASVLADCPDAIPSLAVKAPSGVIYPKVVTKDGTSVNWIVSASDCAQNGAGNYQLTFINDEEVIKTFVGAFRVYNSLTTDGPAPDPIQQWIDEANEAIGTISGAVERAENAATASETAQGKAEDAQAAAETAQALAEAAEEAAEVAEAGAETAQGKAEDAQAAAESARDTAEGYVTEAQGYADDAQGYANDAAGSAETAGEKAQEASGYADNASGYASDAQGYASAASGYADSASGYANQASGYADDASGYATTAGNKATEAGQSATAAAGSATTAGNKATEASASATAAANAKTAAEAAAESIEDSAAQIATNTADISSLKSALNGGWVNTHTRAEVHAEYIYTNSKLYKVNSVKPGVTKLSDLTTSSSPGTYNYKIPVDGEAVAEISYPEFKTTGGYGCFATDENDVLVWAYCNTADDTGTQTVKQIPKTAKYFYLTVTPSINNANPTWYYSEHAYGIPDVRKEFDIAAAVTTDGKRVLHIDNSTSNDAKVFFDRTDFSPGSSIEIVSTGANVFDGVVQSGYWNGNSVTENETHKCTVNPIYVNGGDTLIFTKPCRVTEFTTAGTYHTSYMADANVPYLVSKNTNYIHFSTENANITGMYVSFNAVTNEAYKKESVTVTVPSSGENIVDVTLPTYANVTNIFVKLTNSPGIYASYKTSINNVSGNASESLTELESICSFSGVKKAQSPLYTAHRGSVIEAPENTTYAIVQAFKNGFKNVEIDVRMTSDGVPVLLHDSTINRTSNGTGAVSSMTLETLRGYDFGSWFGAEFAGAKIPTLDEACNLCRALNIRPHLDISGSTPTETMINAICDILKKYGLLDGAVFYANSSNSGAPYLRAYYGVSGNKYYMYYQVAGFGDASILALFENINTTLRNYDMIYDIGISANITDMNETVLEAAASYDRPIPIAVYFVDSYADYQSVQNYPYALYCTNRGDIPNYAAQYFAAGSIW